MIEEIGVDGFQSLRKVKLKLGRLTVLVGESRSGKTALLRSFEGLVTNKPEKGYLSDDADVKDAVVYVKINDNGVKHKIGWRKGTKSNYYKVDDVKFDKVGQNCPDEVKDILKIGEFDLGNNKKIRPNLHGQFDIPFLQSSTGTEIAKILGEITDISQLLRAIKKAKQRKNENKQILGVRRSDLLNVEAALEKYKELDGQLEGLNLFCAKDSFLDGVRIQLGDFKRLRDNLGSSLSLLQQRNKESLLAQSKIERLKGIALLEGRIDFLSQKIRLLDNLKIQYSDLKNSLKYLEKQDLEVEYWQNRVNSLKDVPNLTLQFEGVKQKRVSMGKLKSGLDILGTYAFDRDKKVDLVCDAKLRLQSINLEIEEFKRENELCPTCGRPWNEVSDCK